MGGGANNDAYLAALALEHRASVVCCDFGDFDGVQWDRPDVLIWTAHRVLVIAAI